MSNDKKENNFRSAKHYEAKRVGKEILRDRTTHNGCGDSDDFMDAIKRVKASYITGKNVIVTWVITVENEPK